MKKLVERILLFAVIMISSLIFHFTALGEQVQVEGGSNITLQTKVLKADETYIITVEPKTGWHFVGETHVEGEGWKKQGERSAILAPNYSGSKSEVFTVHIWGLIAKDSGEGTVPEYHVRGGGEFSYYVKSESPVSASDTIVVFQGEMAVISSYSKGEKTVSDTWTVTPLSGGNGLTFSSTDTISVGGGSEPLQIGGYEVSAEKGDLKDSMQLLVVGLDVKLDPPVISLGKIGKAKAKLVGPYTVEQRDVTFSVSPEARAAVQDGGTFKVSSEETEIPVESKTVSEELEDASLKNDKTDDEVKFTVMDFDAYPKEGFILSGSPDDETLFFDLFPLELSIGKLSAELFLAPAGGALDAVDDNGKILRDNGKLEYDLSSEWQPFWFDIKDKDVSGGTATFKFTYDGGADYAKLSKPFNVPIWKLLFSPNPLGIYIGEEKELKAKLEGPGGKSIAIRYTSKEDIHIKKVEEIVTQAAGGEYMLKIVGIKDTNGEERDLYAVFPDKREITTKFIVKTPFIDIDTDSDNNGQIEAQDGYEDSIEYLDPQSNPDKLGKIIPINGDDKDCDGKTDYLDYEIKSADFNENIFAQVRLRIPGDINPDNVLVRLSYSCSEPPGQGGGLPLNRTLRLWTKPSNQARNSASLKSGGDFVKASTDGITESYYTLAQLGLTGGSNIFYLEAVSPGRALKGTSVITAELILKNSEGTTTFTTEDKIRVYPIDVDMDIEYPANYTGDMLKEDKESVPGIFLIINDDHDGNLRDQNSNRHPDNSDDKVNGNEDKKDMMQLTLQKLPSDLPADGKIIFRKLPVASAGNVRIFEDHNTVLFDSSSASGISDAKAKALYQSLKSGDKSFYAEGVSIGEFILAMECVGKNDTLFSSDFIKVVVGRIELEPITVAGGIPPHNPCGVEFIKTAKFAINVEPINIPDDKIEWKVKKGHARFWQGDNTGRLVTVYGGFTEGDAELEVSIPGHKGPPPRIKTKVVPKKIVKVFAYIVATADFDENAPPNQPQGTAATTKERVRELIKGVNKIYEQVAIEFELQKPVEYIYDDDFLDISKEDNYAEFKALTSERQNTGGIEVYFVDTIGGENSDIIGANLGPGYGAEDGMVITDTADFVAVAHEIGHAGGLNDIYTSHKEPRYGFIVELDDSIVKKEWLPKDWNNGPEPQYYHSSLEQRGLLLCLLMNGRKVEGLSMIDITSGMVYGVNSSGEKKLIRVGGVRTPSHD